MNLHDEQKESRIDQIESGFVKLERVVIAFFNGINSLITNGEYSFLNMVTAIIPWLVFLVPASMTWENTGKYLGFLPWLQWVTAIVVEALGIVAGSELMDNLYHNRKKENRAKDRKVNPIVSWVASIFYLLLTVFINAILEATSDEVIVSHIIVKVMLTLMGAVAISIVASRKVKYEIGSKQNRQMSDNLGNSGNYVTYDYRNEIGNIMGIEQKAQLLEMGKKKLKRWIMGNWQGINPEIAVRWIRFIQRDVEDTKE